MRWSWPLLCLDLHRSDRCGGEAGASPPLAAESPQQLGLFESPRSEIEREIEKLDLDRLTPFEALLLLREWRQKLR